MAKLLTVLSLILIIVLFPPAALALISNNAVPGDAVYPIKRKLEDGILLVASVNPATRAWFSTSRADRRFNEAKTLIAQGKTGAGETLDELVSQAAVAAQEIQQIQDTGQKEQLKQQFVQSIQEYNQGLGQIQQQIQTPVPATNPAPTPVATQAVTLTPSPLQSAAPKASDTPVVVASPNPTQNITPIDSGKLDDVKKRLEEIQKGLETDNAPQKVDKQENKSKDSEKDQKEQPKQKEDSKTKDNKK